MSCNNIYFDHGTTTYVRPEVLAKMLPHYGQSYADPSALYSMARISKYTLANARQVIKECINAHENDTILFTSGGTQSNSYALMGIAESYRNKGNHIIVSKTEHVSVINTCKYLENNGFLITYIDVDEYGFVDLNKLEKAINDKTVLISVAFAEKETGTLQNIKQIGFIAHKYGVLLHTDASAAAGFEMIDVQDMNIDLLSISAHKFHGPKGVGALYVENQISLPEICAENLNIPAVSGMAEALKTAYAELSDVKENLSKIQQHIIGEITENIPDVILIGHPSQRLFTNVNLCFKDVDASLLISALDLENICAATSSRKENEYVLSAMNVPCEYEKGSLKITLGFENTQKDADKLISVLGEIILKLRKMNSFNKGAN